jgi:hypothetical protein
MKSVRKFGVFFASAAMLCAPIATGVAAEGGSQALYMTTYVPAHASCPGLSWHINRVTNADQTIAMSGPIWYDGGSGMSYATGTGQANGTFVLNVRNASGNGPTGTITGQRMSDGSVQAKAVGSPCLAGTYNLRPGQTTTSQ